MEFCLIVFSRDRSVLLGGEREEIRYSEYKREGKSMKEGRAIFYIIYSVVILGAISGLILFIVEIGNFIQRDIFMSGLRGILNLLIIIAMFFAVTLVPYYSLVYIVAAITKIKERLKNRNA